MLEVVEATGFVDELGTGRTFPVLVFAERQNGEQIEVVAKLSGGECRLAGLVREAFSAMLAADLGLPVPEPVLVDFPPEFADIVPPSYQRSKTLISNSITPTFGTLYMRGLPAFTEATHLPRSLLEVAAEIVVFDGMFLNPDRRDQKPNCLTDGKGKLVMIDHELALTIDGSEGSFINPYPWTLQGMSSLCVGPCRHILLPDAKGKGFDVARLEAAWKSLSRERFLEYAAALPTGWDPANTFTSPIVDYLSLLLDHTDELFLEARRILA